MKVTHHHPAAKILAYVQSILVIENDQVVSPFVLPLFANGTPTLLFSTAAGTIGDSTQHLALFGQTVQPQQMVLQQNFKLVAYFLRPFALSALFHVSAAELTDQPIALAVLKGQGGLQEQLLNATTTEQVMHLIDGYLHSKITGITHHDKQLIYAAEKIGSSADKHILATVQQELHITERSFQRLFQQYIGVSPNIFRRISQFSRAFRQINEGNCNDLSAVAYHNGYADQSHFIRVFKEFTHLTPSAYLNARP